MLYQVSSRNAPVKTHKESYADQHDGHQLLKTKTVEAVQTAIENTIDLRVVVKLIENQPAAFGANQRKICKSFITVQKKVWDLMELNISDVRIEQ